MYFGLQKRRKYTKCVGVNRSVILQYKFICVLLSLGCTTTTETNAGLFALSEKFNPRQLEIGS